MGQCYFAGSNSGKGFYSCFKGLCPSWEALEHFFIIKGGPGVGKNTLMKKIAAAAENEGETVERFFCSGDPESLDAVRLTERRLLFADGTAPHCMDPDCPGAEAEILNFGEYIDRQKIKEKRSQLLLLMEEHQLSYRRAYAFLRAAAALQDEIYKSLSGEFASENVFCFLKKLLSQKTGSFLTERNSCFSELRKDEEGNDFLAGRQERRLFLDAVTCDGEVSLSETLTPMETVVLYGEGSEVLLDWLQKRLFAEKKELFCHPLLPERISHVRFPEQGLFLTSKQVFSESERECLLKKSERNFCFSMEEFADQSRFLQKKGTLFSGEKERLTKNAVYELSECKRIHDEIELIYRECVDFDGVTEKSEQILDFVFCGAYR